MPNHFARAAIPCIALVLCTSAAWAQETPPAQIRAGKVTVKVPDAPGDLDRPTSREPGAPTPIGHGSVNCTEPVANCQDFVIALAVNSNSVNFIAADDFVPAADGVITSVCWWGLNIPAPFIDAFTMTVYLDIGGLPGPIIGGPLVQGFTLFVTKRDTGLTFAGFPIFEFTATLGAPFAVAAGVCYWLEIKDSSPDGTSFFWVASDAANGGNGRYIQDGAPPDGYTPGDIVSAGDDLSWCFNIAVSDPFTCIPPPEPCLPGPNPLDCCADREPIFNGKTEFSTESATTDPDQPAAPAGCTGGPGPVNDIWYNYNADFTGNLRVTTCEDINGASTFDTVLVAYDGCDCDPLGPVLDCNDDDADNPCGQAAPFQSTMVVPVVAGNCYKIRLGGFSGGDAGTGVLDLTKEGPPEECQAGGVENNCCAARTPVFNGATEFSTVGASTDGPATDIPGCGSGGGQNFNDIWYNYNADFTGDLIVSTCNGLAGGEADYDTNLTIYDGCGCDPLSPILDCDDDTAGCAGFTSQLTVPVVAGNCYKIRLGGFDADESGTGILNITKPEPINNDLCEDRRAIFNGKTEYTTVGADTDGPPHPACTLPGGPGPTNDIWYNYTADFTGGLQVSTCEELNGSADFDTMLVVYDGCSCDPLSPLLGCNDDDPDNPCGTGAGGFHSTINVPVTAGNCYKIRLGGFGTADSGSGVLDLTKKVEGCPECNTPSSTDKVLVCHRPPGNPANGHTICIEEDSADEHLEVHAADTCGPCADEAFGVLPGMQIDVKSNLPDVFIAMTPDIFDDGGATAAFVRFFRVGDTFILDAPKVVNGEAFLRWNVTSGGSWSSYGRTRLVLTMVGEGYEINAVYTDSSGGPTPPSGR